jgi:hypothetical protein
MLKGAEPSVSVPDKREVGTLQVHAPDQMSGWTIGKGSGKVARASRVGSCLRCIHPERYRCRGTGRCCGQVAEVWSPDIPRCDVGKPSTFHDCGLLASEAWETINRDELSFLLNLARRPSSLTQ